MPESDIAGGEAAQGGIAEAGEATAEAVRDGPGHDLEARGADRRVRGKKRRSGWKFDEGWVVVRARAAGTGSCDDPEADPGRFLPL